MTHSTPRLSAAESFVRHYVAHATGALPSTASLAQSAGVSYVTMWKAIASLRARGELTPRALRPGYANSPAPVLPRWHDIRSQLIRDIVSGRYAAGAQIGYKQVISEYGACYRTARLALESLESRGWLGREKKQFRVRSRATGGFGETVVLLSNVERAKGVSALSPRLQELIRSCEIHCSRMHLGLEPILVTRNAPVSFVRSLRIPATQSIAGYLVWLGDIDTITADALLARLAATGKAVSVLDEVGEITFERAKLNGRRTALFSIANSVNAGRAVGAFLAGLGHRQIGFLSHERRQPWGANRLRGMQDIFAETGLPGAIRSFPIGPEGERKQSIDRALDCALKQGMSAVVAETDSAAIECLELMATRGLTPGRDIAVAGFDDTPDAFLHNLTSYNFNCESTIHAMLAHLYGKRIAGPGHSRVETVEIEGFVTPRGSTACNA